MECYFCIFDTFEAYSIFRDEKHDGEMILNQLPKIYGYKNWTAERLKSTYSVQTNLKNSHNVRVKLIKMKLKACFKMIMNTLPYKKSLDDASNL